LYPRPQPPLPPQPLRPNSKVPIDYRFSPEIGAE